MLQSGESRSFDAYELSEACEGHFPVSDGVSGFGVLKIDLVDGHRGTLATVVVLAAGKEQQTAGREECGTAQAKVLNRKE